MKQSAGILIYKKNPLRFLLVHPGGPYFSKKDKGWWTIPKGEIQEHESALTAALREFEEETGFRAQEPYTELQPVVQKGGKKVFCWAAEGDFDTDKFTSNTFEIEWPPKSGTKICFPEIDTAKWFTVEEAKVYMNAIQLEFIAQLEVLLTE